MKSSVIKEGLEFWPLHNASIYHYLYSTRDCNVFLKGFVFHPNKPCICAVLTEVWRAWHALVQSVRYGSLSQWVSCYDSRSFRNCARLVPNRVKMRLTASNREKFRNMYILHMFSFFHVAQILCSLFGFYTECAELILCERRSNKCATRPPIRPAIEKWFSRARARVLAHSTSRWEKRGTTGVLRKTLARGPNYGKPVRRLCKYVSKMEDTKIGSHFSYRFIIKAQVFKSDSSSVSSYTPNWLQG